MEDLMDNNSIKVGIIENDPEYNVFLTECIGQMAEVSDVFSWESVETFWRDKKRDNLDLVIIDINLPGMNGVDLAGMLEEKKPELKKIILSSLASDEHILNAMKNGCLGYILKSELEEIQNNIRTVISGGSIITPTIALKILKTFTKKETSIEVNLTDKEKQILEQLVTGYNVSKTAEILGISKFTAQTHIKNIYKKLSVTNRQELMLRAREMGFF